jgi:hypothetical protein
MAVGQAARECGTNVLSSADRESTRPRLVITTDQTFTSNVIWAMGADPFAWKPRTQVDDDQRSGEFVSYLRDRTPDTPWSPIDLLLLDPSEIEAEAGIEATPASTVVEASVGGLGEAEIDDPKGGWSHAD